MGWGEERRACNFTSTWKCTCRKIEHNAGKEVIKHADQTIWEGQTQPFHLFVTESKLHVVCYFHMIITGIPHFLLLSHERFSPVLNKGCR